MREHITGQPLAGDQSHDSIVGLDTGPDEGFSGAILMSSSSSMTYELHRRANERRYTAHEVLANVGMTPNEFQSRFLDIISGSSLPPHFEYRGRADSGKRTVAIAHALSMASQFGDRKILFTVPDACDRIAQVRDTSLIAERSHLLKANSIRHNCYYVILNNGSCLSFRTVGEVLGGQREIEILKYSINIILDAHNMRQRDVFKIAYVMFESSRTMIVGDD